MKYDKLLVMPYVFILLFGCQTSSHESIQDNIRVIHNDDFSISQDVYGKIVNVDLKTEFVEILTIDTLLILQTSNKHKEFFKIYNIQTFNHLGDIGLRGEAPGEWKYVDVNHVLEKHNDNYYLWVSDRFNGFLKKIDILKSLNSTTQFPVYEKEINVNASLFPFSSIFYVSDNLVADIGYEDDTYSRFKKLNLTSNQIEKSSLYPSIRNYQKLPSPVLFNFYISDFRKHPTKNIFVSAMAKQNRIDFIDDNLNLNMSIVDGVNWKDDYFDAAEIDVKVFDMFKIIDGYYATSVTEDLIFTKWRYEFKLEDPPTRDISIIKVFDWTGNPIAILNLDCSATSTSYDKTNKILFVLDASNEQILTYDLNAVL